MRFVGFPSCGFAAASSSWGCCGFGEPLHFPLPQPWCTSSAFHLSASLQRRPGAVAWGNPYTSRYPNLGALRRLSIFRLHCSLELLGLLWLRGTLTLPVTPTLVHFVGFPCFGFAAASSSWGCCGFGEPLHFPLPQPWCASWAFHLSASLQRRPGAAAWGNPGNPYTSPWLLLLPWAWQKLSP